MSRVVVPFSEILNIFDIHVIEKQDNKSSIFEKKINLFFFLNMLKMKNFEEKRSLLE